MYVSMLCVCLVPKESDKGIGHPGREVYNCEQPCSPMGPGNGT